jgi:hypothetical protein
MALGPGSAMQLCRQIVANARTFGGTVVVNWHDRSLAPERLWDRSYRDLLKELDAGNRAWYCTAADAVDWFRWRRSITFRRDSCNSAFINIIVPPKTRSIPAAVLQTYRTDNTKESAIAETRLEESYTLNLKLA